MLRDAKQGLYRNGFYDKDPPIGLRCAGVQRCLWKVYAGATIAHAFYIHVRSPSVLHTLDALGMARPPPDWLLRLFDLAARVFALRCAAPKLNPINRMWRGR